MVCPEPQPPWAVRGLASEPGLEWALQAEGLGCGLPTSRSGHGPWPSARPREHRCPPILYASCATCCGSQTD